VKGPLFARLLSRSGVGFLMERTIPWSGVLVLNYHRIGDPADCPFDRGLWSATSEAFSDQIRFLKSTLDIISPDELASAVRSRRGRFCLLTFDDGYRDNFENAFPILKAANVPATFFVVTGFLDAPKVPWWDEIAWMIRTSTRDRLELPEWLPAPVRLDRSTSNREAAIRHLLRTYKTMPAESTARYLDALADATGSGRCSAEMGRNLWMDWEMLRQMRAGGMAIGGHTTNHPILARATPLRQREEIVGCGRRLAEVLGEPMRYFSYPVGGRQAFDAVTRSCLREAGVRFAFSYYGGFRGFSDWDDYDVRRVPVETCMTTDCLRAIVTSPMLFA
jgi:peptidoglycan/xylan/chitin deacetylase (PgdA/CDA1 family)